MTLKRETLPCQYGCDCTTTVDVDRASGAAYDTDTGEYLTDLRNSAFVCDVVEHGCFAKVLTRNLRWYGHERGTDHPKARTWDCPAPCLAALFLDPDSVDGPKPVWEHDGFGERPAHAFRAVLAHHDLDPDGPIWIPDYSQQVN